MLYIIIDRLFLSQIIIVEMITEIYFYIYIENCYYLTDYINTTKFQNFVNSGKKV